MHGLQLINVSKKGPLIAMIIIDVLWLYDKGKHVSYSLMNNLILGWFLNFCFKHFDTRYLVFCNLSAPSVFLLLGLLSEYRLQHGDIGPLYVTSSFSTWIFCRGVSGFATDCPCGVWCRGLTTYLLHVGPPFGNRLLNNSWAVGLT